MFANSIKSLLNFTKSKNRLLCSLPLCATLGCRLGNLSCSVTLLLVSLCPMYSLDTEIQDLSGERNRKWEQLEEATIVCKIMSWERHEKKTGPHPLTEKKIHGKFWFLFFHVKCKILQHGCNFHVIFWEITTPFKTENYERFIRSAIMKILGPFSGSVNLLLKRIMSFAKTS